MLSSLHFRKLSLLTLYAGTMMMRTRSLMAALTLMLLLPAGHAQLYKWVDANGQTHYSDRKDEAATARVDEVKVTIASNALQKPARVPGRQQFEADIRRRQIAQTRQAAAVGNPARPSQFYYTNDPETDASRCTLAQDIVSGRAVHRGGRPTDSYDRNVAGGDIKRFCH